VSTAKINGILSPDARDRTATPSARNCWYVWVQLGPTVDDMVGRTVSWGDMDSMTSDSTTSPGDTTARARLFGGNRLKLGVMAFNCSHGSTITTVPEAWKLNWADTVDVAQAVDRSGMEALLPVGRWRGYGGPSDFNSTTFESFT
jgi:hypothetical protein